MKISVIIPVYNKAKYLATLLQMIAEQSFRDYECLLIDDGSTDGTGAVCDEFARSDDRFQAIHIPNGGVSHARNIGLEKAKGEYITFIDGDDEIHQDYLKNLYQCIRDSQADLVISSFQRIRESGEKLEVIHYPIQGLHAMREILSEFASLQKEHGIFGWCWAKIFPAQLAQDIRFDETLVLAEDVDFYLRLYPQINTIYFDEKPYYYYRSQAENSSMLRPDNAIDYLAQLKINIRYRDFLKQMRAYTGQNQEIVDRLLCSYVYFSLFYCPLTEISARVDMLHDLCQDEHIALCGNKFMERWLLLTLKLRAKGLAKVTLASYRFLRKVKK